MRSTPEHEVSTCAQNVYETLRDKQSCRARFHDHFRRLNALWFFAQRERPIHFPEFPVSTALPQRFCRNCQTSVLFRLGAINFHLRLHGRHSAYSLAEVTTSILSGLRHRYVRILFSGRTTCWKLGRPPTEAGLTEPWLLADCRCRRKCARCAAQLASMCVQARYRLASLFRFWIGKPNVSLRRHIAGTDQPLTLAAS